MVGYNIIIILKFNEKFENFIIYWGENIYYISLKLFLWEIYFKDIKDSIVCIYLWLI